METEFETERIALMDNLTLLEDHGSGVTANCPYCMEKHSSKIAGYAFEIAAGKEEDYEIMTQLGDIAQEWQKRCIKLKDTHDKKEFEAIGIEARDWRRKIQGAHTHKGEHDVDCIGSNCEVRMDAHNHGET